ncbi:MAG: NTP transferase domain-containing protein [Bacteroidota bacterium]
MTTKPKHTSLARPDLGKYGRNEWSILGTPCGEIKKLANELIQRLHQRWQIAYIDADHKGEEGPDNPFLEAGATLHYTDKISYKRFDYLTDLNEHQIKSFFQSMDLVLLNGNHFESKAQIVVIDPAKSLEKKLDKLTNVQLVLLKESDTLRPAFLTEILAGKTVLPFQATDAIADYLEKQLLGQRPVLNGLVLAGGLSTRMQRDKGLLNYHGKPQREVAYELLSEFCSEVYVSCRKDQVAELEGKFNCIPDTFLGLGPKGGILSAFRHNPNAAWLVLACDLPFLNTETLNYLVENRHSTKAATAFLDSENKFPEPLITIYEPKCYPILLQMLGMGYACPRKTLINADVALLQAPDFHALTNINAPQEYEEAIKQLQHNTTPPS